MNDDLISRQAALDIVFDFAETPDKMYQRIRELPSIGGWIPCGVVLPEEKKAVYWVCNDRGDQFECRWTNANYFWTDLKTKWHWSLFDAPQYSKVVAWMPLPEPYKEEE